MSDLKAPANATGVLVVCPTTHIDWDWIDTFIEYVTIGPQPNGNWLGPTDQVLDGVVQLLADPGKADFRFSLAEIGYLRRFLGHQPSALATLQAAGIGRFLLMGGGITSPDNLVCNGEVFIRNYLLGRQWLRSAGLRGSVGPIAWLPDDFGHDPQLPVVLAAMGLTYVGLSRVPGSPQGSPCAAPTDGSASVAAQLNQNGLVFHWQASDGSKALTHYMPNTYGVPFYGNDGYESFGTFVQQFDTGWPVVDGRSWRFAPAGGDFALALFPNGTSWLDLIGEYDAQAPEVPATPGTFLDYMDKALQAAGLQEITLQAQNYWTGHFASRPRLKILHNRAARNLLAAEAASTLLRAASIESAATLDALDRAITTAWEALVPSSHHDYVTGTSPDRVYWNEQLPLLELAARLAEDALEQGVARIAGAVQPKANSGEIPVVVFNPVGLVRPVGNLAELPAAEAPQGVTGVRVGQQTLPVQRLADGGLLLSVPSSPGVPAYGYETVYLQTGTESPVAQLPATSDEVTLENQFLTATLSRSAAWAITSLLDNTTQQPVLASGGSANAIRIYTDTGNLYQFGNEPLDCSATPPFGQFQDQNVTFESGPGEWLENGPLRFRFRAGLQAPDGSSYVLEYSLAADEPMLRMRLTGSAPSETSVVTEFSLVPSGDPLTLTYGTANHWDDHQPVPYWSGPTFRATHDFVLPTGGDGSPLAAVYHGGIPAWSVDTNGHLLGVLLRNAPGMDRGAAGTDPNVHQQEYALRMPGLGRATTGQPLAEALAYNNPLRATLAANNQTQVTLPVQTSLAGVVGGTAILRAARTQDGSSTINPSSRWPQPEQVSFVLRVYLASATADSATPVTITLPFLSTPFTAEMVTALEEPLDGVQPTVEGNTLSFTPTGALSTIRINIDRPATTPTNGK